MKKIDGCCLHVVVPRFFGSILPVVSQTMEKGTIIGVAAIHATSDVDVLRHQNKELYGHVRRLKRKLHKQKAAISQQEGKAKDNDAYVSAVQRYWAELENSLKSVIEVLQGSSTVDSGEPPQKKQRIQVDVATSLLPLLAKPQSQWLSKDPIAKPAEEEEEEDEEEDADAAQTCNLAELEQSLKSRVKFTVSTLESVLKYMKEGVSNGAAPSTESALVKLRDAQSGAEAYLHRCIHLQKQVAKLKEQLEDSCVERDVAIRRLNGWKSLPKEVTDAASAKEKAAAQEENGSAADVKVKEEGGGTVDSAELTNLKEKLEELGSLSSAR